MKFVTDDAEWKRKSRTVAISRSAVRAATRRQLTLPDQPCSAYSAFSVGGIRLRQAPLPAHLIATSLLACSCLLKCHSCRCVHQYVGALEMIAGHFNNFFYDLGEVYGLKFVRAACDKVTCLKEYHGESQPIFLFYLGGSRSRRWWVQLARDPRHHQGQRAQVVSRRFMQLRHWASVRRRGLSRRGRARGTSCIRESW